MSRGKNEEGVHEEKHLFDQGLQIATVSAAAVLIWRTIEDGMLLGTSHIVDNLHCKTFAAIS